MMLMHLSCCSLGENNDLLNEESNETQEVGFCIVRYYCANFTVLNYPILRTLNFMMYVFVGGCKCFE